MVIKMGKRADKINSKKELEKSDKKNDQQSDQKIA